MFGTGDSFDYVECTACGTVQINEIPELSRYYPDDYYSFSGAELNGLRIRLLNALAPVFYAFRNSGAGKWMASSFPSAASRMDHFDLETQVFDRGLGLGAVLASGVSKGSRILDVGCGTGRLLDILGMLGFSSLTGIDAFLDTDRTAKGGARLLKKEIADLDGEFDLIMFHHSFEHLADPANSLRAVSDRLASGGMCLVRIPLVNYAWEEYGVNWVGLDAPRHLHLFSERAFKDLAEKAGFDVERVVFDSTSFQFVGSELYSRGLPLNESIRARSLFTSEQIRNWKRKARELNQLGRGDQAAFYLTTV